MGKNRYTLIAAVLLMIACSYFVIRYVQNRQEPQRYVRYEAHSEQAKPHLAAMEKAIRIMRNLPCENPLSWYYQGAVHWIPDSIPNYLPPNTTESNCPIVFVINISECDF